MFLVLVFELGSYIAQADLKLTIYMRLTLNSWFSPPPIQFWDFRSVPIHSVSTLQCHFHKGLEYLQIRVIEAGPGPTLCIPKDDYTFRGLREPPKSSCASQMWNPCYTLSPGMIPEDAREWHTHPVCLGDFTEASRHRVRAGYLLLLG